MTWRVFEFISRVKRPTTHQFLGMKTQVARTSSSLLDHRLCHSHLFYVCDRLYLCPCLCRVHGPFECDSRESHVDCGDYVRSLGRCRAPAYGLCHDPYAYLWSGRGSPVRCLFPYSCFVFYDRQNLCPSFFHAFRVLSNEIVESDESAAYH